MTAAVPVSETPRVGMAFEAVLRPAPPADADRGLARLARRTMRAAALHPGDIVAITGCRTHFARVLPDRAGAEDRTWIGLCRTGLENVSPGEDGLVTVRPVILAEAAELRASLPQGAGGRPLRQVTALAHAGLADRPVAAGDLVRLASGERAPLELRIATVVPPEGGRVVSTTRIVLLDSDGRTGPRPYAGVGGLADPVARLREMVDLPLARPELFERLGITPPRGVLFTGPPGSGKTLLARAVAEEASARFFRIDGPEIVSKHYGDSEARLRDAFAQAEREAPAIIFIDEIDAIAPRRDGVSGEKQLEKRVVAQLLTLMDGLSRRGRVVVMAATNLPHMLDPALRRPGRFDREIAFPAPDAAARREILDVHTARMPLDPSVDLDDIARRTHGYVGADLAAVAREAAMATAARATCGGSAVDAADLTVTAEDFEAGLAQTGPSALRDNRLELTDTRLADVGGLGEVKQALIEAILWPLTHPATCRALGVEAPNGILLSGPPGGGKTMLARALACESGMNFISGRGTSLLSQYLGEAERMIADLFARARHAAPCLLFFDEIDALAPARGGSDGAMARVVAQLLVEIDGIEETRGVVLLAATNRVGAIDPALLRPGRFDRVIEIGPPDETGRREILALQAQRHPVSGDVDLAALAAITGGWTGAELASLCQAAARHALRRHVRAASAAGEPPPTPRIGLDDFLAAVEERAAGSRARCGGSAG